MAEVTGVLIFGLNSSRSSGRPNYMSALNRHVFLVTCGCMCSVHVHWRSTDFQERASATCTGLCMFAERRPYNECFYLCNWSVL